MQLTMKKFLFPTLILLVGVAIMAFSTQKSDKKAVANTLKWYTWTEAAELNKTQPKKLLVDVYTDWCGWCKVMDKQTFTNDTVIDYLNKHFYCVKLDAEMRDSVVFNNNKFVYVSPEQSGSRNGIHTLAYSLLDGNMSFPTIVYLTENFERVVISPGYKTPEKLLPELRYTAEEAYKKKTFQAFMDGK
jgi:thioredoxin-related protein